MQTLAYNNKKRRRRRRKRKKRKKRGGKGVLKPPKEFVAKDANV
jgi:hypothetical protein